MTGLSSLILANVIGSFTVFGIITILIVIVVLKMIKND